jgi:hypothetical protein
LTEWRPNAQDDPRQDIFIAGYQEKCRVIGVLNVGLLPVKVGRYVPRLLLAFISVILMPELTKVVFELLESQQPESRHKWRFGRGVVSTLFVIQGSLLVVSGRELGMDPTNPLLFVSFSIKLAEGSQLTEDSDRQDQDQINEKKLQDVSSERDQSVVRVHTWKSPRFDAFA